MAKTEKLGMELPQEGRFISAEFPLLRKNLTIIDQAVSDLDEKVDEKAPSQHTHVMSEISGLEDALSGKMEADKTFALVDLTDVESANDAAENHVLYKSGKDHFAFSSAQSLVGEHQHTIEDITGLEEYVESVNEGLTNYGRLSGRNEWKDTNVFKGKISVEKDIELTEISSLTLKQNDKVVTNLNATGSSLKGPLKVDDELVYTKPQADKAISEAIEKLKQSLTDENSSCSVVINKLIDWPELADAELLYTQSGKIEWPDWITDEAVVEIQAWGGGGSGGGSTNDYWPGGGGGGGGGSVWYGYKRALKGRENFVIGKGGASVQNKNVSGNAGGDTTIGDDFIKATGGRGGGAGRTNSDKLGEGGEGGKGEKVGNFVDGRPGLAKHSYGSPGTKGTHYLMSGHGGDAGGDTSRGGCGGIGTGRLISGKPGRGFGGGGSGAHGNNMKTSIETNGNDSISGSGADGAVLIRIWKKPYEKE
ncbi:Bgr_08870 family protein [Bartonella sp. WD16.2]|uniref:Bgr_08870 family protein n=1 Tax=Bartonella sp. WD16.2 TaxID=1933904 RepID=UPI00099B09E2|nr:Bgr_08870 family protein [Bartonella sp. WD16.2]AQX19647.1 Phage tail repeat like [Bartonella sp. WD16.2]